MSDIQPNTPEARKLARKTAEVFYWIAAANIVLVVFVFWPRAEKTELPAAITTTQTNTATPGATIDMEAVLADTLTAYNAKSETEFTHHFSAQAVPPMDTRVFQNLIVGVYHQEFGEVVSKALSNAESAANPDYGMLVYSVECRKRPKAKLSVNFHRENGVMKVVQWRMENL
jgi:hypothetical protein